METFFESEDNKTYKGTIYYTGDIYISLWDRIRLLFLGKARFSISAFTENLAGDCIVTKTGFIV